MQILERKFWQKSKNYADPEYVSTFEQVWGSSFNVGVMLQDGGEEQGTNKQFGIGSIASAP